jgi:hypothetical protein
MRNKNELKIHAYVNKSMNAMNVLMNRFIGFGGFGFKRTTTVVATTVVATTLMYKAYKAYRARTWIKHQDQPPTFENRYLKEYDALADDPDAAVPPPNNHVRETTPQGDVIMTYDANRCAFCYYSDKRSVQFKYLEPVARKYVLENGCKRLHVDIRKATQATQVIKATQETQEIKATPDAPKKDSVFAQLKKYGSKPSHVLQKEVPQKEVPQKEVTRYLHCGTLNEFADVVAAAAHDFNVIKPIDYASYKKMTT